MRQSPLTTTTKISRAVRLAVLGASLATLPGLALLPAQAMAQSQGTYQISAGPLGNALTQFGVQAGVTISFDTEQTRNLTTNGLDGAYSVDEGLARLLGNSGLRAERQGNGGYVLVASQASAALELGATEVTSNQLGTITEGSGSYTPGTIATATRLVLTPRETPQSITVITRQHMNDFGLNSIDDVMRHTPGITVSTFDSERTNYYARGFSIENFQYDGIPTLRNSAYSSGQTLSDMAIYDRVEILKGATGLLTGAGAPGGTINLIRKKPTQDFKASVELGAGSWDNYRSQVDVSGPLTDSGNVRGRAVMAYQDKHSFMDRYERKTSVYFGTVEADLGENTLLTVGFDYQNSDPKGSGWSGSRPLFDRSGNRIDVSRSYNNGAKWSSWEQYTQSVFSTLEHNFANGWVLKGQYTHQYTGYDAPMGAIQLGPFPATGLSTLYANKFTGDTRADSGDIYASGPFNLLGREHELVVGASASNSHWSGKDYGNPTHANGRVVDFWSFDGNFPEPNWNTPTKVIDETTRQTAGYLTTRLNVTDDLNVFLGSRVANYWLTGDNHSTETGKLVPYAGVTYDLNNTFTAYASYTNIFMPQVYNRDSANKLLEPDEGKNYEVGIKGEFFGGKLNTSLAYFEVHETNRAEPDAEYNANPTTPGIGYANRGIKAKTKGYEAEVSGELAPGWQIQAGYTHKIIRDEHGEKVSTWEPEDQVSLYTTYKLQGPLDRLTIGGGARWQGKAWQNVYNGPKSRYEDFVQEDYWLVDVMAKYQVTDHVSATLNVNNLFDKYYYTNIGFYNTAYYGDPRNVMVTTRWDF
ncbi:TonB-dependent siderophore receptor [Pseudomonas sp. 5P_5.1_Bac1]|uniref:TonB-dependent siderophore receptor n=1 Tax=Pseudomonas sp. 5P_5.1_Bac1 TaxID=2971616 RepID=UPI0021CA8A9B|nr:TonB-dependent siderophore receptor [Pseudomonas sp. 5P_5.1_Bac1]MCU1723378.1 TonB-dependent siderophore receptor [Pseudomonas sp. 5P_5.1_Bac1]